MNSDELLLASRGEKIVIPEDITISLYSSSNGNLNAWNTNFPQDYIYEGDDILLFPYSAVSSCILNSGKQHSITFSNIKKITSQQAFEYAFQNCTNLISIAFPRLTTISGGTSYYQSVFNGAFKQCTNLTSVSFPKLTSIDAGSFGFAFLNCTNLTSVSFPKLTSVNAQKSFYCMGTSSLTVHLPKNLSSLGITNYDSSNSDSYCSFVYDL